MLQLQLQFHGILAVLIFQCCRCKAMYICLVLQLQVPFLIIFLLILAISNAAVAVHFSLNLPPDFFFESSRKKPEINFKSFFAVLLAIFGVVNLK